MDISPIYAMSTKYNVGGTLTIPYYDETDGTITVGYQDEFSEITATSGKLKSISLSGYLVGALTKVSRSLMNNSQFDILGYAISKLAEAVAMWIDKEIINGTTSKIEGLSGATNVITTASATAITADELIDLQDSVPDIYQPNSISSFFHPPLVVNGECRKNAPSVSNGAFVFGKNIHYLCRCPNIVFGSFHCVLFLLKF